MELIQHSVYAVFTTYSVRYIINAVFIGLCVSTFGHRKWLVAIQLYTPTDPQWPIHISPITLPYCTVYLTIRYVTKQLIPTTCISNKCGENDDKFLHIFILSSQEKNTVENFEA